MYAAGAVLLVAALLARVAAGPPGAGPGGPPAGLPEPPEAVLRCPPDDRRCSYIGGSGREHQYRVEDNVIMVGHKAGTYLSVECNGSRALESAAAPRAAGALRVREATLAGCAPPAGRSLAALLAALNVSAALLESLALAGLPRRPPLEAAHFRGLERLRELRLAADAGAAAAPARGFLAPLVALEVLLVQRVALPPGELDAPPPRLRRLRLQHAGVDRLPAALLASRELRHLTVASARALDAAAVPPGLLELDLWAPAVALRLDAAPALPSLVLSNWSQRAPPALARCANLTLLRLSTPAARALPPGWLAACPLRLLELQYAKNLTSLPARLLTNASELELLSFKYGALESLPADLLDYAPRLRSLYLAGNRLLALPSGVFARAGALVVLDLSSNRLRDGALAELAPLRALAELSLQHNPQLEVRCDPAGNSPFRESTELRKLNLKNTSVSQICSDWRRELVLLDTLNLQHTRLSRLWFEDLQYTRTVKKAIVFLEDTPITQVTLTRKNYNAVALGGGGEAAAAAAVQLGGGRTLACDCYMYWTRRALDAAGGPLRHVSGLVCADGRALRHVPPADMLCADDDYSHACREAAPPAACACGSRPDDDPASNGTRVRLACAGRGLRRVPLPPPRARVRYELLLARNDISELPPAALRPDVAELDLSSNSLRTASEETATKLYNFTGILRLAGNELDCSCSAAPLLTALGRRPAELRALAAAACAGGAPPPAAPAACAPLAAAWLAAALAALLALALLALAFLASRERRFFFKAVLYRWGLWRPGAERADAEDGRPYDAFVTFSHKDEARVLELVARLEPAYRLCVHYRDWVPGRTIAEQIAESVADSRRTIALVSRHFLDSGWALAEFRQAHAAAMLDARPRLVVVLLEEPAALRLDAQLRRYLATNTYVRWSDPWLWDKLALALPRPRPPAPPQAPAAAPPAPRAAPPAPAAAPVPPPLAPEPAPKRSPADAQDTMSTDVQRSSAITSTKSVSSNEVELAPLCPAPAGARGPQLARDVKAALRLTDPRLDPRPDPRLDPRPDPRPEHALQRVAVLAT